MKLTDAEREALSAVNANRCSHCLRVQATEWDWERFADNEGDHLCWEEPDVCGWVPTTTPVDLLAPAVERIIAARLAEQHRAICEYSLIEENAGMACTYTGVDYRATTH